MPRKVVERGQQANQARDEVLKLDFLADLAVRNALTTPLNPAGDPDVDARLREGNKNLATALATGGIGVPGDIAQLEADIVTGLLNAHMQAADPTGRVRAMAGQFAPLQSPEVPFSGPALQRGLGGDPEAPESLLGAVGSPEITDLAKLTKWGPALLAAFGFSEIASRVGGKKLPRALEAMRGGPAYHGTPHKFDQFDLEKIGTGEGAQAYGHGLYFAENPGVAKSYQANLAADVEIKTPTGNTYRLTTDQDEFFDTDFSLESAVHENLQAAGIDVSEGDVSRATNALSGAEGDVTEARRLLQPFPKSREVLDNIKVSQGGHLYEVDIPDETIDKMLDWDAPLSEQPESVRKALEGSPFWDDIKGRIDVFGDSGGRGESIYELIGTRLGSEQAASKALNEAGIPGIRYYDGSSRFVKKIKTYDTNGNLIGEAIGKTDADVERIIAKHKKGKTYGKSEVTSVPESERTRNIVVFNPDDIKSVKRDGELVYEAGKPTTSGPK